MRVIITKCGNSLALRIPTTVAERAAITEGIDVNIIVVGDRIIIAPRRRKYTLEQLLEGMTPDKFHPEFTTGSIVGNEVF